MLRDWSDTAQADLYFSTDAPCSLASWTRSLLWRRCSRLQWSRDVSGNFSGDLFPSALGSSSSSPGLRARLLRVRFSLRESGHCEYVRGHPEVSRHPWLLWSRERWQCRSLVGVSWYAVVDCFAVCGCQVVIALLIMCMVSFPRVCLHIQTDRNGGTTWSWQVTCRYDNSRHARNPSLPREGQGAQGRRYLYRKGKSTAPVATERLGERFQGVGFSS